MRFVGDAEAATAAAADFDPGASSAAEIWPFDTLFGIWRKKKPLPSLRNVKAALGRERAAESSYWTSSLALDDRDQKLGAIHTAVPSCSKSLNHNGFVLSELADSSTDPGDGCSCAGLEDQAAIFPKCCHARFAVILEYVARTMPKFGIVFWIHAGTLLGSLREGGFIPFDSDTDVSLLMASDKDWEKWARWLQQASKDGLGTGGFDQATTTKTDVSLAGEHLDFYFWKPSEDRQSVVGDGRTVPANVLLPLAAHCNFHGFRMPCPAKPQEFLQYMYPGSDLAIPEHK